MHQHRGWAGLAQRKDGRAGVFQTTFYSEWCFIEKKPTKNRQKNPTTPLQQLTFGLCKIKCSKMIPDLVFLAQSVIINSS